MKKSHCLVRFCDSKACPSIFMHNKHVQQVLLTQDDISNCCGNKAGWQHFKLTLLTLQTLKHAPNVSKFAYERKVSRWPNGSHACMKLCGCRTEGRLLFIWLHDLTAPHELNQPAFVKCDIQWSTWEIEKFWLEAHRCPVDQHLQPVSLFTGTTPVEQAPSCRVTSLAESGVSCICYWYTTECFVCPALLLNHQKTPKHVFICLPNSGEMQQVLVPSGKQKHNLFTLLLLI